MRSVEVRIPGHPPGGNDLHRMNRFQVRKSRDVWKTLASQEAARAWDGGPPMTRATLAVSWRYRIRRTRDLDNLIAGLKPIVDGLVVAGILEDDHSGILVGIGPLDVVTGAAQDETVLTVTEERSLDE